MKANKEQIIQILETMATLLELRGENPFKIRAFHNAVRTLETMSEDLQTYVEEKRLQELPGIGKGLSADITELANTGHLKVFEDLKKEFPETVFELFKVPGLGPKKIKALYEKLDIKSLGELEYACIENRLTTLDGFGEKTQKKILEGLMFLKKSKGLYLYADVLVDVEAIVKTMTSWKEIDQVSMAGSLRRRKEIVHDADIVCSSDVPAKIMDKFEKLAAVGTVTAKGDTKMSVVLKTGFPVDLRVVAPKEYIFALHHFTGSKEHNTWLRGIAKDMDLKLNEYGLWKGDKSIRVETEEELFKAFDMPFIPPELREAKLEIEIVEKKKSVPVLIEPQDIKGFFHMHTTLSDGKNSLEEMVKASIAKGYEYMGVSDHSQSAFYAHGLKRDDIQKQHAEIDEIQKKYPQIKIFKGIESDILNDGSLDYPPTVLSKFDFVIASIHSNFKMTEEEMTQRCLKALQNQYTTMLGHPTGRLLLGREGFPVNLPKLIDEAAKLGKVVELNASPHRLDLDWRILPYVKQKKVPVSINPDAHSIEGIDDIEYGVMIARKAGLEKENIWNTMSAAKMEKKLEEIRER